MCGRRRLERAVHTQKKKKKKKTQRNWNNSKAQKRKTEPKN